MAGVPDIHTDHLSVHFCRISLKHQSRDFSEKSEFFFYKSTFWRNFYLTFIENKSLIPKVSCVLLESLNITSLSWRLACRANPSESMGIY